MKTRYKPNRFLKQVLGILFAVFVFGAVIGKISGENHYNGGSDKGLNYSGIIKDIEDTILSHDKNAQNGSEELGEYYNGETDGSLLYVHIIDVGQADSILIMSGQEAMLIDAGNNEDGQLVSDYLKNQGVKKLNYVIGTHPHEDHIGGLDNVIDNFQVDKLFMPKVTANTRTFEDVVDAANRKSIAFNEPVVGQNFKVGGGEFTILAPVSSKYSSLNNYSIVIRLQYGNVSFLFTGDAEKESEKEMLKSGINLKADVLKVGHHGGATSSTEEFLKAVSPEFALISVGANNDYGHPAKAVLNRLENIGAKIHRTDIEGNIVISTDGKDISFVK